MGSTATNGSANGTHSKEFALEQGMVPYAAPSLFQPHNMRQAIRDAHEKKIRPLMAVYFGLSSVPLARFIAPMGFDSAWIDWEHSSCNVETMTTMVHELMFMSGGKTAPWVRVPGHDHAAIGYALDCGASVVIPQVETVEQAKFVLSSAKFGTKQNGSRSAPPFRLIPGLTDAPMFGTDTHKSLNDQAAVMIQIESLEGIKNLDAILTEVPEIDVVWLGTLDARISMNMAGNSGMGGAEAEWQEAVALYESTMTKHNKPRAGFAIGEAMIKEKAKTFSLLMYDADVMRLGQMIADMPTSKQWASEGSISS